MIKIDINANTILVSGHAKAAPYNNDIVCAGVSAIVLGAASYWQTNQDVKIEQKDSGYLKITFLNDVLKNNPKIYNQFEMLLYQLNILAKNYYQYIKITKK